MRSQRVRVGLRGRARARDKAAPSSRRWDRSSTGGQEHDIDAARRHGVYMAAHQHTVRQVRRLRWDGSSAGGQEQRGDVESARPLASLRGKADRRVGVVPTRLRTSPCQGGPVRRCRACAAAFEPARTEPAARRTGETRAMGEPAARHE